jgi:hypothetical protein
VTCSEGEETETDDIQAVTTPENEETDDEMSEVSNVAKGLFHRSIIELLRPHILINSIAEYYEVPRLKRLANKNIRSTFEHS